MCERETRQKWRVLIEGKNMQAIKENQGVFITEINKRILPKPKVDIVVVIGRKKTKWYQEMLASVQHQYYDNLGYIEVENQNRDKSIGKCLNIGINSSSAEFILFLGDDDIISSDYIASCIAFWQFNKSVFGIEAVQIGSGVTHIDSESLITGYKQESPCGMWKRDWLIKNQFNEDLPKLEDVDLMNRADQSGAKRIFMDFHFGYLYRQHHDQNSRT